MHVRNCMCHVFFYELISLLFFVFPDGVWKSSIELWFSVHLVCDTGRHCDLLHQ